MIDASSLKALVRRAEGGLVEALGLRPLQLDPEATHAVGTYRGRAVTLETRAYRGQPLHYARFVEITGEGLAIGNMLCTPCVDHPLPILGVDLVMLGDTLMLVADLSPTLPPGKEREAQLAPLDAACAARSSTLPPGGALPAWCTAWFSPFALYTRVAGADLARAASACDDLVRVHVSLCTASAPAPQHRLGTARAVEGYAAAHREHDKGLRMLAKLFGEGWAARYIAETLFPALLTMGEAPEVPVAPEAPTSAPASSAPDPATPLLKSPPQSSPNIARLLGSP
ncbi:hypothetical protein [Chondromyces apiculatus]|uniref:Phycocyanobilin:ferredoxin oxidoreductase n=1 Tax=Chondromyces apiculatus DSM 436 TaxID=1192034 RepID=A0A017TC06_9BACT|nr:hypothetical protein [Chondromyces apiculatus]EYF06823.1 phycocyanobilin:ferredoxin oxidoreductase [Chondromyces apiculatus DSM 436]